MKKGPTAKRYSEAFKRQIVWDLERGKTTRTEVAERYGVTGGATSASPPPVYNLLQDVEQCDAAYLGGNNSWLSAWPEGPLALKPRAIRIRLSLAGRGQFERLYYLP